MRKSGPAVALTHEQLEAAGTGVKAMVPVGRPFIEYQLSRLADAGYDDLCLVTGPEHQAVRDYCSGLPLRRIRISHAIQAQPRGTADAVAASAGFAGSDEFLVINSDNLYPTASLAAIRALDGPGLVAFAARAMIEEAGVPADRIAAFPRIRSDEHGILTALSREPGEPADGYVSMNCWRFGPTIFDACRSIPPSPRNELELPDAVEYSMTRLGQHYRVMHSNDPVLDLSSRADIGRVTRQLADVAVRF